MTTLPKDVVEALLSLATTCADAGYDLRAVELRNVVLPMLLAGPTGVVSVRPAK